MANFDIKSAIMKKQDDRMKKSKLTLTDVNRKEIKKTKDGYRDSEGFLVLQPRI